MRESHHSARGQRYRNRKGADEIVTKLDRVTITGADSRTDIQDLLVLSEQYPFVEWGILMSPKHQGFSRFPCKKWMRQFANACLFSRDVRVSLHLCGAYVRGLMAGGNPSWGDPTMMWDVARRVQLNFHGEPHDADSHNFGKRLFAHPDIQWVFQMDGTPNEEHFYWALGSAFEAVPLFDTSGGAGKLPPRWLAASVTQNNRLIYHGYAGGLGPDVLAEQLPLIEEAAGDAPFWIDMEGHVRTDEVLDMAKVDKVLSICEAYMGRS